VCEWGSRVGGGEGTGRKDVRAHGPASKTQARLKIFRPCSTAGFFRPLNLIIT